jgi:mannose-1-phosphate guanylyltransferase/mannose-6-phosphate isomerase
MSLFNENSLLQNTILRAKKFAGKMLLIGNESHKFLISQQLQDIDTSCDILLEPFRKNTLASSVVACLYAMQTNHTNALILPSDQYLEDSFFDLIDNTYLDKAIVTFAIKPTAPSTEYGHIKFGSSVSGNLHHVEQFIEKPNLKIATQYFNDGDKYWNSGIFLLNCEKFLKEVEKFEPETLLSAKEALEHLESDKYFNVLNKEHFSKCKNISIDYGIIEKTKNIYAVKCNDVQWSDLGTWSSVHKLRKNGKEENAIIGKNVYTENVNNSIIVNQNEHMLTFCSGIENLSICITNDALLISDKNNTNSLQEFLKSNDKKETKIHSFDYRPWGKYENLIEGKTFKVKKITVKPNKSISLQLHYKRDEHWIITNGTAEVVIDHTIKTVNKNESVFIPRETKHRITNIGNQDLVFIEIQYGEYFGEDDIVRFNDEWGRS